MNQDIRTDINFDDPEFWNKHVMGNAVQIVGATIKIFKWDLERPPSNQQLAKATESFSKIIQCKLPSGHLVGKIGNGEQWIIPMAPDWILLAAKTCEPPLSGQELTESVANFSEYISRVCKGDSSKSALAQEFEE